MDDGWRTAGGKQAAMIGRLSVIKSILTLTQEIS